MSENLPDDPLVKLLDRLIQNNSALVATVEDIALWIDQQGDPHSLARIHEHLAVIRDNSEVVQASFAELVARAALKHEEDPED
ncbi:hypothetical protein NJC38_01880 [Pseudomonas sp. 21LCFQ010]|uniref:hypothetical protein n=1 Tax=Pseudomonas sp. 21LCFQ010 TaxID=2957506 RepID=UPI0020982884|nr:hypothetical protein [Pseudomonas sp. 21LCFQ010]MCO8160901.1 hypothetical protein [Pseudomonas sp. 21LCFQ010]